MAGKPAAGGGSGQGGADDHVVEGAAVVPHGSARACWPSSRLPEDEGNDHARTEHLQIQPAGDEERVFDKFFRSGAAPRGAGLGLTIARGIIEAHGGRIWAHNRPEGGAAFFFWLPRTRTPPPVPTESPAHGGA